MQVLFHDFNEDGLPDLFIGSRSIPGGYGLSPISIIVKSAPETDSYLLDSENLSILDNRFIRSNNVRTMFKFESDFFTHLLGSDTNGVSYGGLITEQNDLTNWFPSLLDDGSSTNWVSLLTNCDAQGCNTSSSSLFDSLDPLAADHRLSDSSVINHMNTIAAVPVSQNQRDLVMKSFLVSLEFTTALIILLGISLKLSSNCLVSFGKQYPPYPKEGLL